MPAIPTTIIMGFLGVGKTSAILSLFGAKPTDQRWAVLVNEFGQVGIDGGIYRDHGIAVKEVPGGCVCCVQGVPMQVAINRLIKEQRPDRLIIETSGIGHPRGILRSLRGENYQGVLQLRAGIALVDPEKLLDPRYLEHELFNDQLAVADVLVANKVDLASLAAMQRYGELAASFRPPKRVVAETVQGRLDPAWLDLDPLPHKAAPYVVAKLAETSVGYDSHGWFPGDEACFSRAAVEAWMAALPVVRVKALLPCDDGPWLFNGEPGRVIVSPLATLDQARIEVLGLGLDAAGLEAALARCLVPL